VLSRIFAHAITSAHGVVRAFGRASLADEYIAETGG
jgi:hypothetical protein